jgi:hypothetical protein
MNSPALDQVAPQGDPRPAVRRIPVWIKVAYTAFCAVLVPVYLRSYGPSNFLFFCDVALLLTLAGMWLESPLVISMCCVGILLPQMFWLVDFASHLLGVPLTGMTGYMFRPSLTLFARGLSLFHGWLPLLLMWLVSRLGYDRRALGAWGALAVVLVLVSYLFMPAPGAVLANPNSPVNIDYVYGFSDKEPQHGMNPSLYAGAYVCALWVLMFLPTHALLCRIVRPAGQP